MTETAARPVKTGSAGETPSPARKAFYSWASHALITLGSLVLAFAIWQFLSSVLFNPFLIPPPLVVFRTAIPMLASGEILHDVTISMTRVLVGFITGSAAGVVIGVLLG